MTQGAWFELYQAAMMEIDPLELRNKIDYAVTVLEQRRNELANGNDPDAIDEHQKLTAALRGLQTLRRLECQESTDSVVGRQRSQETTR